MGDFSVLGLRISPLKKEYLNLGYLFSKFDGNYGGKSWTQKFNFSVKNQLIAVGLNYNRYTIDGKNEDFEYVYRSIDIGYIIHKRFGNEQFVEINFGNNFPNLVEKPDYMDLACGKEIVLGTSINGGIENIYVMDLNYQISNDSRKSGYQYNYGAGMEILSVMDLSIGMLVDDPNGRLERHYGYGGKLSYKNIQRLLSNIKRTNQTISDYGIQWSHSVIIDIKNSNGGLRDGQTANELNAYVKINI